MNQWLAFVIVAMLITSGCGQIEQQVETLRERVREDSPLKVKTVNAFVLEANQDGLTQEISGTVKPRKEIALSFGASGKIARFFVEKGSVVKAGTVLAALDVTVWQQEIAAAKGQVDKAVLQRAKTLQGAHKIDVSQQKLQVEKERQNYAKAAEEYAKGKLLFQNEAISREELNRLQLAEQQARINLQEEELRYDKLVEGADKLVVEEANADVKEAAVKLSKAQQDLQEAVLKAPFSGVVASIQAVESEQVSAGTEVIKLIDPTQWLVQLQVESDQVGNWQKGKTVTLHAPDGSDVNGTVSFVSPVLDQQTGTFAVEVVVDGSIPDWKSGMTVSCRYQVKSASGLLVPVTSVGVSEEGHYVMKITPNLSIERTEVQVGAIYGEYYEILQGLEAGDEIVKSGLSYVLDGEAVKVANE